MNGVLALDDAFYLHAALTLLHFLWQGLLLAAIACLTGWCLHNRSAAIRYQIYAAAMVLMLACLPATLVLLRLQQDASANTLVLHQHESIASIEIAQPVETSFTASDASSPLGLSPASTETVGATVSPQVANVQPHATAILASPATAPSPTRQLNSATPEANSPVASAGQASTVEQITRWTLAVYLLGVSLMFTRTLLGLSGTRRLRRDAQPLTDPVFLEAVRRRARQFNLRSAPVVAYCNRVAVPALVGLWRPMILLPTVLATGLTPEQLELVIVHELAHIRRWDNAWLIVQRTIESILFFHPAVWYISRRMSIERELCCDEMVVATAAKPSQYAESLLRVVELTAHTPVPIPSGATMTSPRGGSTFLVERLMRILGEAKTSPVRLPRLWPSVLVTLLVLLAVSLVRLSMYDEPEIVAAEAAQAEKPERKKGTKPGQPALEEREFRMAFSPPLLVLPEGVCIELVGVSVYPQTGASAWTASGAPLDRKLRPNAEAELPELDVPRGKVARLFRFNILSPYARELTLQCSVKGRPRAEASTLDFRTWFDDEDRIWDTVFLFSPDTKMADLVVEATGRWTPFSPWYSEAAPTLVEGKDGAELHWETGANRLSRELVRAVVITPEGREIHAPAELQKQRDGRTSAVFRFPHMSVDDVRDYRLERRYEGSASFHKVSLQHGYRTDVAVGISPNSVYWANHAMMYFDPRTYPGLDQLKWAEQHTPGSYSAEDFARRRSIRDRCESVLRRAQAIAELQFHQAPTKPIAVRFGADDIPAPEESLARLIAHHELYRRHTEALEGSNPQWRHERERLMSTITDPGEIGVAWFAEYFHPEGTRGPRMGPIERGLLAELKPDQDEIFMRSRAGSLRYLQRIRAQEGCVGMCHVSNTEVFLPPKAPGVPLKVGDVLAILGIEILPEPAHLVRVNLKGAYAPAKPLETTITPAGQCLAPNGAAIANAEVVLYHLDWPKRTQRVVERTRSNQQGRFQFVQVPVTQERSDEYTIVATAAGRATAFMTFPNRKMDGKQLELQMPEASELRGQVLGPGGTPVQGAMVWTHQPLPLPELGFQCTTTDENGNFVIDDMPPGKCKPMLTPEDAFDKTRSLVFPVYSHHPDVGYAWRSNQAVPGQVTLRLSPGAVLEPLDFDAEAAKPAAKTRTDTESAAKIVFPLYCRHPDFAYTWQTYEAVPSQVLFRLEPGAVIEGRVVYAASGKPAAGIAVGIQNSAKGDYQQTITDNQGRYRFRALRPEKYNLWIDSPEWMASATDSLEVISGETQEAPDLKLVRGATISGRLVHGVTGKPLTLTEFHSLCDETGLTRPTVTDPTRPKSDAGRQPFDFHSDGSFLIRVPPGENTISYTPPAPWSLVDHPTGLHKTFSLTEGQHLRLDLWLTAK